MFFVLTDKDKNVDLKFSLLKVKILENQIILKFWEEEKLREENFSFNKITLFRTLSSHFLLLIFS